MNPCGEMYVSINAIPTMKFDSKAGRIFCWEKYIFSIRVLHQLIDCFNAQFVFTSNPHTQNVLSIIHEVLLLAFERV